MFAYNQDLDELIQKLRGNDPNLINNLIDIIIKMVVLGYGHEFITFLFEIADEGFHLEIQNGNYDTDKTLEDFDTSLILDEKVQLLSIVGNEIFEDIAVESFSNQNNRDKSLVMINSLVRLLINGRYYVNVYNPDDRVHDSEVYQEDLY